MATYRQNADGSMERVDFVANKGGANAARQRGGKVTKALRGKRGNNGKNGGVLERMAAHECNSTSASDEGNWQDWVSGSSIA